MPSITLKNIPEALHRRHKQRATRNRRSLNWEVIELLDSATAADELTAEEVNNEIKWLRDSLPELDHALIDEAKWEGRK